MALSIAAIFTLLDHDFHYFGEVVKFMNFVAAGAHIIWCNREIGLSQTPLSDITDFNSSLFNVCAEPEEPKNNPVSTLECHGGG